ncbi:MAG TPA: FtsW/RodA/SpoVE family cell cycle protein [Mycobacteriales bacterium]|nr:FtsW/RodA/SpoVE family cell cycle protein [Mycobacteriales bacterium]
MSRRKASETTTVPKRRGVELAMLILAAIIVLSADAIVDANVKDHVSRNVLYYGAGFAALWFIAHLVVRWVAPYADPLILPIAAVLNGLGLVLIYRIRLATEGRKYPSSDPKQQVVWMVVGLLFFICVLLVIRNHRTLTKYAYTLAFVGLILLVLPAVLPARLSEVNGARIWIRLAGFSIQPGEFAKLALMIFFAAYLYDKRDVLSLASRKFLGLYLPRGRDLGPVLVAWLASLAVLVRETDLGSSLLFFGMFIVMLYVATERTSWLIIGLLLFAGGAFTAYHLFAHVQERVSIWLHPFANDNGYQIAQSLFGLGTGGLFGTGLGLGHPEIVPYAESDFIVSTIGEELGMFGLVAILVLYALLVARGFRISMSVRDSFGKLLAAGLAVTIGLQVFIVTGGVTKLIPLTGLTTPFLSYGGSSLVANFGLIALLLRISDASRRPAPPSGHQPALAEAPTEVVTR